MMITLFWIYRGLRVGVYASLNIFLVLFFTLLLTVNYRSLLMPLVGRFVPQASATVHQCISTVATFAISLAVLLFICLWLSAERIPLHRGVDVALGGLIGAATGVIFSAALLFLWWSFPLAERYLPVETGTMIFPCHTLTFRAMAFVGRRMPGDREFNGDRFLRDLRFGLPEVPAVGDGFYVSSIPTGLSVFFDGRGLRKPEEFYLDMKKNMAIPEEDIPPSQRQEAFGRKGRTPLFIPHSGDSATIAVMMEGLPSGLDMRTRGPLDRFVPDGEVGVAETYISNQELFVKVYQVSKTKDGKGNIGTLVALFEPTPDDMKDRVRNYLPLRVCFPFGEAQAQALETELVKLGFADRDAVLRMIDQLRLGGKAAFSVGDDRYVIKMISRDEWRIEKAPQPIDLEAALPKDAANRP